VIWNSSLFKSRHARESGHPGLRLSFKRRFKTWIPAFAGMTAPLIFLLLPSCKVEPPKPPLVLTVAVLPFDNESNDLNAPDILQELVFEALSRSAYRPVPIEETNQKLQDVGIMEGGQLPALDPGKMGKDFGVQALLYGYVESFDYVNIGFYQHKKVTLHLKLVEVGTGQTLWENSGLGYTPKVVIDKDKAAGEFAKGVADQALDKWFNSPLEQESEAAVINALKKLPGFVFAGFDPSHRKNEKIKGIGKEIINGKRFGR